MAAGSVNGLISTRCVQDRLSMVAVPNDGIKSSATTMVNVSVAVDPLTSVAVSLYVACDAEVVGVPVSVPPLVVFVDNGGV